MKLHHHLRKYYIHNTYSTVFHDVRYVPQVREEQMVRICLSVHVCVAPPMIVGAWSMAVMLW